MDSDEEQKTHDSTSSTYPVYSLDQPQRQVISRLHCAWKELGWKPSQFDLLLETAGLCISRRSLNRWSSTAAEPEESPCQTQKRGRPSLLDEAGAEVVIGYCISRLAIGQDVRLGTVVDFCRDSLDVKISLSTASNILAERGFSQRIAQVSSSGTCVEPLKLAKVCSNWIKEQRDAGLFSGNPLLLGSIDFTYTKFRTTVHKTFAIKGGLVNHFSLM